MMSRPRLDNLSFADDDGFVEVRMPPGGIRCGQPEPLMALSTNNSGDGDDDGYRVIVVAT